MTITDKKVDRVIRIMFKQKYAPENNNALVQHEQHDMKYAIVKTHFKAFNIYQIHLLQLNIIHQYLLTADLTNMRMNHVQ